MSQVLVFGLSTGPERLVIVATSSRGRFVSTVDAAPSSISALRVSRPRDSASRQPSADSASFWESLLLYSSLACAGEAGVTQALKILRADVERTIRLLGCPSVHELDESFIEVPAGWKK